MTQERIDAILSSAIAKYGSLAQVHMAIEEMAELTNALMKDMRGRVTAEEIITEIADVTIMMRQLQIMMGIDKVNEEIDNKVERLFTRLSNDKNVP